MKVTFPALVTQEITREIAEADLAALNDLLTQTFLNHLQYATIRPTTSFLSETDEGIVALCQKYNVDPYLPESRLAFFRALLGRS